MDFFLLACNTVHTVSERIEQLAGLPFALHAELARGVVLPATHARFQAAIADLVARGAEVIVLACTKFGMVVQAQDSPVPVIDTTIAHAQAAVEMALAGEPVQPGI